MDDSNNTSLINQDITTEELFGIAYDALNDLVHYLAIRYSQSTTEVLMEKDEIVGELYLELWKGCLHYINKNLSINQLLSVLKVMLSNRMSELRYRYFKTHRKESKFNISIDITINGVEVEEKLGEYDPLQELISTNASNPADIFESHDFVLAVRAQLNQTAKEVFDAVIYGNEQLTLHVWLSSVRATNVYKSNKKMQIKPYHIASALCLSEAEVKVAMESISTVLGEVYSD